ncbi:MAG: hypothetical protein WD379_06250 [Dehalococcoidia bacterium]
MQIVLDTDEAQSLMSLIASYVIDHGGVSSEGKSKIRRWRTGHDVGTAAMDDLTVAINESLGTYLDEKLTRTVRRKGRYQSTKGARA